MRVRAVVLVFAMATMPAQAQDYASNSEHVTSQSQAEDFGGALGGAVTAPPRKLLPIVWNLIKDFEGWSAAAYNDAAAYCTIGYGHLIAKAPCEKLDLGEFRKPISAERGADLLDTDSTSARNAVRSLVKVELNHEQFGALSSFVFNVGKTNFEKSTMLRLLNAGETKAVVKQFARWVSAGGTVFKGLVERRSCEAALFAGRIAYDKAGKFQRSSCNTLGIAPGPDEVIDILRGE